MVDKLTIKGIKMEWLNHEMPQSTKKIALLIPQFNESSNCENFHDRLSYFKGVAKEFKDAIDVILIDDGSTDGSLEQIRLFKQKNPDSFFVASVFPNGNKVGALQITNRSISHEFIVLSDFDTDIVGFTNIIKGLNILNQDSNLMGGYFRMLPFEGSGRVFDFQQLEYSLDRSLYHIHRKEGSVPVMPGAGCCYKRIILDSIFDQHSGFRNGEDREATLLGIKHGYNVVYLQNVLALTRPPQNFRLLIKQRIRWNLGYLETIEKERVFYLNQIKKLNALGKRTLMDLAKILFMLFMPFLAISIAIKNPINLCLILFGIYLTYTAWCTLLYAISPNESTEFKRQRGAAVLTFPIYKICLDYMAWTKALFLFVLKRKVRRACKI